MNLDEATVGMTSPQNAFLSSSDKDTWSRSGVAFIVKAIELDASDSYGSRWILSVETTAGEKRRIGLGSNARRDAQFAALRANLPEDGIGPLSLVQRAIGSGKAVWSLVDAVDVRQP